VNFVDDKRGWVVGEGGVIFATANGGERWASQTDGSKEMLNAAYFVDEEHGWAVGMNGLILTTIDGGENLRAQQSNNAVKLRAVNFVDSRRGWVIGERGTILRTVDSGETWQARSNEKDSILNFHGAAFINANGALNEGRNKGLFRNPIKILGRSGRNGRDGGQSKGWIVGEGGLIWHTTDDGQSWTPQNSGAQ